MKLLPVVRPLQPGNASSASIVLLCAAVALVAIAGCAKSKARKVSVATVQSRAVELTEQYVGRIQSHHRVEIEAPVAGLVAAIPVDEGQAVKQNDLLFQLSPSGDTSKLDADHQAGSIAIRAPFDGIVGRLPRQQGSFVKQGESLTTLSDNSVMWVYFHVPESIYLESKQNQPNDHPKIELKLANGEKFNQAGKLGAIAAEVQSKSGTIPFRADFPNPEGLLQHGQSGTLSVGRVINDAIVVPRPAKFSILDKNYVFVVGADNVAHQREIVVQHETGDQYVVKSGVDVNDKVVVEGTGKLRDGDTVEY